MSLRPRLPLLACAAFALPAVLLLGQVLLPGLNPVLLAPVTHVVAVVGISSMAALVALAAAAAALRRPRGSRSCSRWALWSWRSCSPATA